MQRKMHRLSELELRWLDRAKQSPGSAGSMDTSLSSSVSEAKLQLALQDSGPTEVQARAAERHTTTTFATLQPQIAKPVIPVDALPEEMRLKPSSEIRAEANTRTKQSKIRSKQQNKLDRLKTLAITQTEAGHKQAIADSATPEEAEVLTTDSDEELQRAISFNLVHFSKHTIEMDAAEQDNNTNMGIATEAATKHCMSCKGTKAAAGFPPGLATCIRATCAEQGSDSVEARMQSQKVEPGQAESSAAQRSGA